MFVPAIGVFALHFVLSQAPRVESAPDPRAIPPSALVFGDVDADGLDDALVLDAGGGVSLLANRGQGRFEDVTATSGLADVRFVTCALIADLDGDGLADLFLGSTDRRLWLNRGDVSFSPIEGELDHDYVDQGALALDHDRDGRMDLLLHTDAGDVFYRGEGEGRFERLAFVDTSHPAPIPWSGPTVEVPAESGPALDEPAAQRRYRRWLEARPGAGGGSLPPGALASSTQTVTVQPLPLAGGMLGVQPLCDAYITDQANASCIQASSVPTLGRLYPISSELFVDAATGNVGLGTTTPTARLHVGGTQGFLVTGTAGVGTIPLEGSGVRMMFYPNKYAFRAGRVIGSQWDDGNVGFGSTAMGSGTEASGDYSTAMGSGTRASGYGSTAMGGGTQASGTGSTAMGSGTVASENLSTAMGSGTVASGANSTAMGTITVASGNQSTAMGFGTRAQAANSTAVGRFNIGGGDPISFLPGDPLFEVGNGSNDITRANAFTILKNGNAGIGTHTPANRLEVSGAASVTGNLGVGTASPELRLHVTGGSDASPTGGGYAQFGSTTSSNVVIDDNEIMARNNGGTRSLSLNANGGDVYICESGAGDLGIGTFTPDVRLHVEGGSDASPAGGGYAQFGSTTGSNVVIDTNEIMARNNGSTRSLSLNADGGNVYVSENGTGNFGVGRQNSANRFEVEGNASKTTAGSWLANSDRRIKTDVRSIEGALDTLERVRPVSFRYTDEYRAAHPSIEDKAYYNVIAQEFAEVFPEYVQRSGEGDILQVDTYPALIHAIAAIRELRAEKDEELAALRAAAKTLADELEALRSALRAITSPGNSAVTEK